MMALEASPREKLILDVLRAASGRISIQDFDILCQLAPAASGASYYDRLRVAEQLIDEGIIEKADGRLRIVARHVPPWLKQGLLLGSTVSWEIFNVIDSKERIQRKVDIELMAAIGFDGESEVVRKLKHELPPSAALKIKHISLQDDSAGFDISAPSIYNTDCQCLLEVKTSCRPGHEFRFYISRNEARVARNNENWKLVAVVREATRYRILGHLRYADFSRALPVDSSLHGKWESASIVVPVASIDPRLP